MSKIALTPNASGTGTFTLAAPNSNTSRTITLPDEAGEVLVNGTNQNVGIGTSSPTTKLQSKGGSISTPTDNAGLIANASASFVVDHANDYGLYTGYVASANDAIGIAATRTLGSALPLSLQPFGGNVGIGTSSPSSQLEVSGSAGPLVQVKSTATGTPTAFVYSSTNGADFGSLTNHPTRFYVNNSERMRIDSSGNVLVNDGYVEFSENSSVAYIGASNTLVVGGSASDTAIRYDSSNLVFSYSSSEKMRIDSSGNLLVGTTDSAGTRYSATSGGGTVIQASSYSVFSRETTASNQAVMTINNTGVDAIFTEFLKDGSTVGSIGVTASGNNIYYQGSSVKTGVEYGSSAWIPFYSNARSDNYVDLGVVSSRFNDIYATNGTIQTSDRNEKQDIEVLSDAETRVAQACKGLLRKFRWKDAVAEKGDDARIHFGIIAQDLQDAFAAEGLDAGRYAMFISSTWWEAQTEVPAVEAVDAVYEDVVIPAVLDEEGNELEAERTEQQLVTEAVEAKEAYTRTDTYETQAEAPEGATERTRLGVRYPELLAFIIGAM